MTQFSPLIYNENYNNKFEYGTFAHSSIQLSPESTIKGS